MYEDYTKQSLPSKFYRELLGSSLCVFNSNTQFIIENLLHCQDEFSWYKLTDLTSGRLLKKIATFLSKYDEALFQRYKELSDKRNRIIHSFQITDNDKEQRLATKEKDPINEQFIITENYLLDFIKENEVFNLMLHSLRDKLRSLK